MISKKYITAVSTIIVIILIYSFTPLFIKTDIHLNEIQVIGSHNSYKIRIQKELLYLLSKHDSLLAKSLEYEHITLTKQLNLGLRSLELDIFFDPEGGYYNEPLGQKILLENGVKPLEFDTDKKLDKPGLKVFHIQDIDFRSNQLLFKDNLLEIKKWSQQNPNHMPLFILINAKDTPIEELKKPLSFTKQALDSIDKEIKEIFSNENLITPDYVRGNFETLEEAILTKGWSKLDSVKGKLLFFLDVGEDKRTDYKKDHHSLKGRIMFINSKEGSPEAAFRLLNNPIEDFDYIKELIKKGYIVRTRADEDTKEARNNDYKRFNLAKNSGAQVISTDYYIPSKLFNSNYSISFENKKFVRINSKSK